MTEIENIRFFDSNVQNTYLINRFDYINNEIVPIFKIPEKKSDNSDYATLKQKVQKDVAPKKLDSLAMSSKGDIGKFLQGLSSLNKKDIDISKLKEDLDISTYVKLIINTFSPNMSDNEIKQQLVDKLSEIQQMTESSYKKKLLSVINTVSGMYINGSLRRYLDIKKRNDVAVTSDDINKFRRDILSAMRGNYISSSSDSSSSGYPWSSSDSSSGILPYPSAYSSGSSDGGVYQPYVPGNNDMYGYYGTREFPQFYDSNFNPADTGYNLDYTTNPGRHPYVPGYNSTDTNQSNPYDTNRSTNSREDAYYNQLNDIVNGLFDRYNTGNSSESLLSPYGTGSSSNSSYNTGSSSSSGPSIEYYDSTGWSTNSSDTVIHNPNPTDLPSSSEPPKPTDVQDSGVVVEATPITEKPTESAQAKPIDDNHAVDDITKYTKAIVDSQKVAIETIRLSSQLYPGNLYITTDSTKYQERVALAKGMGIENFFQRLPDDCKMIFRYDGLNPGNHTSRIFTDINDDSRFEVSSSGLNRIITTGTLQTFVFDMEKTNVTPRLFTEMYKHMSEEDKIVFITGINLIREFPNYQPLGAEKLAIQRLIDDSLTTRELFLQEHDVDQSQTVDSLTKDEMDSLSELMKHLIDAVDLKVTKITDIDGFRQDKLYIILVDNRYTQLYGLESIGRVERFLQLSGDDTLLRYVSKNSSGDRIFSRLKFTQKGKEAKLRTRKDINVEDIFMAVIENRVYSIEYDDSNLPEGETLMTYLSDENIYSYLMVYLNTVGY